MQNYMQNEVLHLQALQLMQNPVLHGVVRNGVLHDLFFASACKANAKLRFASFARTIFYKQSIRFSCASLQGLVLRAYTLPCFQAEIKVFAKRSYFF